MIFLHPQAKVIPQMLSWVEIRAHGRPGKSIHSCLLNNDSGMVWSSVVVLKDGSSPDLLDSRYDQMLQNFCQARSRFPLTW